MTQNSAHTGKLYVVGTPIGNLGDLSPRVGEAFAAADAICCEDTRVTSKLLMHLGISKPLVRCDEKRERFRALFLPLPWPGPAGRYRTRVANGMFAFTLPLEFSPGKAIFVFVKFFLFCTVAVSTCWN